MIINLAFVLLLFFAIRKKYLTWKIYLILNYKSAFDCALGIILIVHKNVGKSLAQLILGLAIHCFFIGSEIFELFLTIIIFVAVTKPVWFSIELRKLHLNLIGIIILITVILAISLPLKFQNLNFFSILL